MDSFLHSLESYLFLVKVSGTSGSAYLRFKNDFLRKLHLMQHPEFSPEGYLKTNKPIEIDLEYLREYFVNKIPLSNTRQLLFENFEDYLWRFQKEVFPWFKVWVNGSFISKKMNPRDIDFVIFLDFQVYQKRGKKLDAFYSFSLEQEGLDAFILSEYPENHPNFVNFEMRKAEKLKLFSSDRYGVAKGFVQLIFQREVL